MIQDRRPSFLEDDDVMRELRAYRKARAEAFDHDVSALFEDLRRKQAEYVEKLGLKVVSLPPKLLREERKAG